MKLRNLLWVILLFLATNRLHSQNSVRMHEAVQIGGISQWIGAIGDDDSKPILLFLHGGPGFSSKTYSKKFIKYLKEDFIVVQWDQRETGITAHWGPFEDSLTLELFHNDTEEVVNYLLKKFSREKLFLVGFSWGGFLGTHFANQHPELLYAYISVSGIVYGNESERRTLTLLKQRAITPNNTEAINEISKIQIPFNSWEELYYQRKWTAYYFEDKEFKKNSIRTMFQEWSLKWMPMWSEASKVNYLETAPKILCPIYFFISENDFVSNYSVTKEYFNKLIADKKQMIWFDQSGHEIPNQEPKKFSTELIKIANQTN